MAVKTLKIRESIIHGHINNLINLEKEKKSTRGLVSKRKKKV